ncbi:cellulose biosynthesis protein BcsG [Polynucleobacter sp. AP-Capit-er-40B-B4]|uniref:cellulose biosynthesis protein BcsG n=1 Tax=Polynucleobacter sp. AP-Capit-er-40B-B4 TaxID=2576927 RepID=UPI001C0B2CE1|nr:cellulose biosynthesis protein BcsG [Polynucleobacter sp. AP-Capit-er-40B-B4]MBU3582270.1 cellulose biosynthesis protein BcsG [Polynucleobacter sp. AP-Capit-er-40B-B4]
MRIWSFYFIIKIILFYTGYVNFHFFVNAAFALGLIFSHAHPRLLQIRKWVALPIGIVLFYFDSQLPPLRNVIPKIGQLLDFSFQYYLELLTRIVNWQVLALLIALYVIYFLLSKKLRMSTIAILAIISTLLPLKTNMGPLAYDAEGQVIGLPSDTELTESLDGFFIDESLRTGFNRSPKAGGPAFDILVINICSLAWDDLKYIKEENNPLFKRFHYLFTSFNSASSYSGPSIIRLLRASRGQQDQRDLYKPPVEDSLLFNNLAKAGFQTQLALNHDGKYGDLLKEIRNEGALTAPLFDNKQATPYLRGFDGSQVYDDYSVLSNWWDARMKLPNERVALFYNTITLHDGNRALDGARLENSVETYSRRTRKLLEDIDRFYSKVNSSGRQAVIIFIPEHGAAIRRNKNEIVGMREIPSPNVTNIPVGIMFTGKPDNPVKTNTIGQPTSYLAASDLLSKFVGKNPFDKSSPSPEVYLKNIPSTRFVAENEDSVIMKFGSSYYFRSNDINWNLFETND